MVRVKALTEKRVGRFVCGPKLFSVLSYSCIFNFFVLMISLCSQ